MEIRYISKKNYQGFYEKAEDASFFHSLEWHQIVTSAYKIKMIYLGFFQDDLMIGVIPVMSRKILGLQIYGAPLPKTSTPNYIFPLFKHAEPSKVLQAINCWVKKNRWQHLQVSWPYNNDHIRAETRFTADIELNRPLEDIWKCTKKWMKRRIRYAARNKVRIHYHPTERYMDEYPKLLNYTYITLQNISPNTPLIVFNEIQKKMGELPLKVFTATHNSNVVAMLWFTYDKNNCYLWDSAIDSTGRELSANHLLHWEVIRWAHKQGFKILDMVGGGPTRGGKRDEGIMWFKLGFGVKKNETKVLYWQSLWIRILFQTYRVYLLYLKDRAQTIKQ